MDRSGPAPVSSLSRLTVVSLGSVTAAVVVAAFPSPVAVWAALACAWLPAVVAGVLVARRARARRRRFDPVEGEAAAGIAALESFLADRDRPPLR